MENCERLYRDNRERVLRFLLHLTGDVELARDLVQETFARYLSRYGRDSEQLGLLFTIARNAGLDALRRRRTSPLPERETADPRRQRQGREPEDVSGPGHGQQEERPLAGQEK